MALATARATTAYLEPEIKHDKKVYYPEDMGPAQSPQGFMVTLVLQDLLVCLLGYLDGKDGILSGTSDSSQAI